jgi:hypothetical protein
MVPATASDEMQAVPARVSPPPADPVAELSERTEIDAMVGAIGEPQVKTVPLPLPPPPRPQAPPPRAADAGVTDVRAEVRAASAGHADARPPADVRAASASASASERPSAQRDLSMPLAPAKRELSMPVYKAAPAPPPPPPPPQDEPQPRTPLSSVKVVRPSPEPTHPALPRKRASGWGFVVGLAVVGLFVGTALRWSMSSSSSQGGSQQAAQTNAARTVAQQPPPPAPSPAPSPLRPPPADDSAFADIPAGITVPEGQGYLTVTAPTDALIQIDGAQKGRGPKLGVALKSGFHEVHVGPPQSNNQKMIEVRPGRASTADLTK